MLNKSLCRKFGQYLVEVKLSKTGKCLDISIAGDYGSNFGLLYIHNFDRFKNHPVGDDFNWNRPQVIGMEWGYGMTNGIRDWIFKNIYNDRFINKLKDK